MNFEELTLQAPPRPKDDGTEVFAPKGVCSKQICFQVRDGMLRNVEFTGGCNGNLQGIGRLVEGMPVADVVERLSRIRCGKRSTSCPDQLARALAAHLGG